MKNDDAPKRGAKSKLRGHPMTWDGEHWRFDDDGSITSETYLTRPCGKCGKSFGEDDHDPCLANLPGVANACCGHGESSLSYIQFTNGVSVSGFTEVTNLLEENDVN